MSTTTAAMSMSALPLSAPPHASRARRAPVPAHCLSMNLPAAAIVATAGAGQPAAATQFRLLCSHDGAAASIAAGELREQLQGVTRVRLRDGATASFVGRARFRLRDDGSVELEEGNVTIVTGPSGGAVPVHMPRGVVGEAIGVGAVACFRVHEGEARGHVLGGQARVGGLILGTRQWWRADAGGRVERIAATGPQLATVTRLRAAGAPTGA